MNGFINSPALAKLVALQMVDEQIQGSRQKRFRKPLTTLRSRFHFRSPSRGAARDEHLSPTGRLIQDV